MSKLLLTFPLILLLVCIFSFNQKTGPSRSIAGSLIKIQSLGSSFKGKYIAVEEYGYKSGNIPFARIRVIDVWKDKELEDIEFKTDNSNLSLSQIRNKNRSIARSRALKYKINF